MTSLDNSQSLSVKLKEDFFVFLSIIFQYEIQSPLCAQLRDTLLLLQDVSYPLSMCFPWNNYYVGRLSLLLSHLRCEWNRHQSAVFHLTSMVLGSVFVLSTLLGCCYFVYRINQKQKVHPLNFVITRIILSWMTGIFFIPCVAVWGHFLQCSPTSSNCYLISNNSEDVVVVAMLVVILVSACYIFAATSYHWWPFSGFLNSRSHSLPIEIELFLRTITALAFCLFEDYDLFSYKIVLLLVLLFQHTVLTVSKIYYVCYYNQNMNAFSVSCSAINLWASVCATLSVILNSPNESGVSLTLYLGFPSAIFGALYFLKQRLLNIDLKDLDRVRNAVEVDIKARIIQSRNCLKMEEMGDAEMLEKGKELVNGLSFQEAEDLYEIANRKFPKAALLYLSWGTYIGLLNRKRFLSMSKLRQVTECNPSPSLSLSYNLRLRFIASRVSSTPGSESGAGDGDGDLGRSLQNIGDTEIEKSEKAAIQSMIDCLSYQVEFWKTLSEEVIDRKLLRQLAHKIDSARQLARINFTVITSGRPNNPWYRKDFARFLLDVEGANEESERQRQMATMNELEDNMKLHGHRSVQGSLLISGEKGTLGDILQATPRACNLFGCTESEILGRSISGLMPKPYSDRHNEFIAQYIDGAIPPDTFLNKQRTIVMKNQQEYLFFGQITVKEHNNPSDEPIIAFTATVSQAEGDRLICILKGNRVCDASLSCLTFFRGNIMNIKEEKLVINKWIPGFFDFYEESKEETEVDTSFMVENLGPQRSFANIIVKSLAHLAPEYYLVEIEANTDSDDEPANSRQGSKNSLDNKNQFSRSRQSSISGSDEIGGPVISYFPERGVRKDPQNPLIKSLKINGPKRSASGNLREVAALSGFSKQQGSSKPSLTNVKQGSKDQAGGTPLKKKKLGPKPIFSMDQMMSNFSLSNHSISGMSLQGDTAAERLEASEYREEPMLRRMYHFIVLCSLFVTVLALVNQILFAEKVVTPFSETLEMIDSESFINTAMVFCGYVDKVLAYSEDGLMDYSAMTLLQSELNSSLITFNRFMATVNKKNYTFTSLQYKWLSSPLWEVVVTPELAKKMSLIEAIKLYGSMIERLLFSLFDEAGPDPSALQFFNLNANGTIPTALDKSLQTFTIAQEEAIHYADTWSIGFLIISGGSLVALTLFVFLPTLGHLQTTKRDVYSTFETMQLDLVHRMVVKTIDKYNQIIQYYDGFGKEKVQDDDDPKVRLGRRKLVQGCCAGFSVWLRRIVNRYTQIVLNEAFVKFSLFLLLTMIYFISLELWWSSERFLAQDIGTRFKQVADRRTVSRQIIANSLLWRPREPGNLVNSEMLRQKELQLRELEDSIIYGSSSNSSQHMMLDYESPPLIGYFYHDLCKIVHQSDKSCYRYQSGVLRRGAHETLLAFTGLSNRIRQIHNGVMASVPNSTSSFTLFAAVNGTSTSKIFTKNLTTNPVLSHILTLKYFYDYYVDAVFEYGSTLLKNVFLEKMSDMLLWRWSFFAFFATVNIFLILVVYRPLKRSMDKDLKRTRNLLFMLPVEVMGLMSQEKKAKITAIIAASSKKNGAMD
jgi:PAS domain-containing protein